MDARVSEGRLKFIILSLQRLSSFLFGKTEYFLLHKQILNTIKLVCTWHIRCLDLRYLSSHVLHKPLTRLLVQPLSLS